MSKKTPARKATDPATSLSAVLRDGVLHLGRDTYPVPAMDDLPRSVRRSIRQAQAKYALPSAHDRSDGRLDVYGLSFEVGEIVLRHLGAQIDLDDEDLDPAVADAQDAAIVALGMRVMSRPRAGEEGETPNEEGAGS